MLLVFWNANKNYIKYNFQLFNSSYIIFYHLSILRYRTLSDHSFLSVILFRFPDLNVFYSSAESCQPTWLAPWITPPSSWLMVSLSTFTSSQTFHTIATCGLWYTPMYIGPKKTWQPNVSWLYINQITYSRPKMWPNAR